MEIHIGVSLFLMVVSFLAGKYLEAYQKNREISSLEWEVRLLKSQAIKSRESISLFLTAIRNYGI